MRGLCEGPWGPPSGGPQNAPPERPPETLLAGRGYVHETYHGRPPFRTSQPTAGRYWGGSAHSPDPTAQSAEAETAAARQDTAHTPYTPP